MSRLALVAGLAAALLIVLAVRGQSAQTQTAAVQKGVSYASFVQGPLPQPDADLSLGQLAATGAN